METRFGACGMIAGVHGALVDVEFDPDPGSLPADPSQFAFRARLLIGPQGGTGEESFELTVCSPEWLAARSREVGIIDGRHHAIVNRDRFDLAELRSWLERRVSSVEGSTWREVAERAARLGYWEFEDYG
jgi:hypothetical protein